jgi:hypothetical protein
MAVNPLKVYNGIAWVEPQSIKRYDGSAWQDVKVSVYDGTKWETSYLAGGAPRITITASEGADGFASDDSTLSLTFTSTIATSNFVVGDITVSNGSLSSFSATSSTVYTATFTPTSQGATTIDVAAGTFTSSGIDNTVSVQFNWTYSLATFGGMFVDDFHTTGDDGPTDSRIAYATTGLQDSQSFPTDADSNAVTTRPIWTFQSPYGSSHEDLDFIRMSNSNDADYHSQWRTTTVPNENLGSGSGTINIEFSFFMSSNNNKDLILYVETTSQGNKWAKVGGLDDGYHFQFYDNTQAVRIRRRDSYSSITTLATSSGSKFSKGEWTTAKVTIEDDGTLTIFCNGVSALSTTSTTYQDFFPSGAGIRFLSAKAMTDNEYNDVDWIKIWKTA